MSLLAFLALCALARAEAVPPAVASLRAEAAILGSFVSDAAAMGLHWEYSQAKIKQLVGSGVPEFFTPPLNLWYKGLPGQGTPYGQQAMAYLTVGALNGSFPPLSVEAAYFAVYNPATCPGDAGGVYLDASTREFLANIAAGRHYPLSGGDDTQADAAAHMVCVTALLAGNTTALLDALEPVIRVTQNTDGAAAFGCAAARLLEKLIVTDATIAEAVAGTIADLRSPARAHPFSEDAALADDLAAALAAAASVGGSSPPDWASAFIASTGQSCDYAFTLPNVAFLAASVDSSLAGFLSGARASILAGGDSGSRGVFFGALAGARLGDAALLPPEWVAKTTAWGTVKPLAVALVAHRATAASGLSFNTLPQM